VEKYEIVGHVGRHQGRVWTTAGHERTTPLTDAPRDMAVPSWVLTFQKADAAKRHPRKAGARPSALRADAGGRSRSIARAAASERPTPREEVGFFSGNPRCTDTREVGRRPREALLTENWQYGQM